MWGEEELGGGYVYVEEVGMHFEKGYYERVVKKLFGFQCGIPGCAFENGGDSFVGSGNQNKREGEEEDRTAKKRLRALPALQSHLRTAHNMTLCELCITHKRDFVSKLPRFTPQGLKSHQTKGDGPLSGFTGHPLCEFCKPTRFYDVVKLHEHLNKEHYKCHICEKAGKVNRFFKDYDRLEWHFEREHFLCRDAQCLAAR